MVLYYILLPLAWLLDDAELKAKVRPWIEWILRSQREDGYFGPAEDRPSESPAVQRDNARDWWPKMGMLKVLQQYYSAPGDERVIELMSAYFRYQLRELPKTPLGHWTFWGEQRGGDNLGIVYWLYNITGDEFLLELGDLSREAHEELGRLAAESGLYCLVTYGEQAKRTAVVAAAKGQKTLHANNYREAADALLNRIQPGDALLVKASRGMALEKALEIFYAEQKKTKK